MKFSEYKKTDHFKNRVQQVITEGAAQDAIWKMVFDNQCEHTSDLNRMCDSEDQARNIAQKTQDYAKELRWRRQIAKMDKEKEQK